MAGGSLSLREYPGELVRLSCEKCGRAGQYRKQNSIERFGADIRLPDLRHVASAAGAAVSTAVFGTETFAVQLNFPGSVSSTSGVRFKVGNVAEAPVADSTSALLPANWIQVFKVTPGQRVSAISNDAGTPTLSIVELTK